MITRCLHVLEQWVAFPLLSFGISSTWHHRQMGLPLIPLGSVLGSIRPPPGRYRNLVLSISNNVLALAVVSKVTTGIFFMFFSFTLNKRCFLKKDENLFICDFVISSLWLLSWVSCIFSFLILLFCTEKISTVWSKTVYRLRFFVYSDSMEKGVWYKNKNLLWRKPNYLNLKINVYTFVNLRENSFFYIIFFRDTHGHLSVISIFFKFYFFCLHEKK